MDKIYLNYDENGKFLSISYLGEEYKNYQEAQEAIPNFEEIFDKAHSLGNVLKNMPSKKVENKDYETIEEGNAIIEEPAKEYVDVYSESENDEEYAEIENLRFSNKALRWLSGILALVTLGTIIIASKGCQKERKQQNSTEVTTQVQEMTLESILAGLKEGLQRDTFKKLYTVQDYFNNVSSKSISIPEDEDVKLYLTSNEIATLDIYANINSLGPEKIVEIYGETGILDKENLAKTYNEALQVMVEYYRHATQPSGLSDLFNDEKEKGYFEEFESLVIAYNKAQTPENKKALENKIIEIFYSGNIDDLKDKYPGATSFIAAMVNSLAINHAINNEMLNTVNTINQTVTCENIGEQIEDAERLSKNVVVSDKFITIFKFYDERNNANGNRNLSVKRAELEEAKLNKGSNSNSNSSSSSKNSKTSNNNGTTRREQITASAGTPENKKEEAAREQAVKEFGEKEVSQKEQEAKDKCEAEQAEKNAKEQARANGYAAAYNVVYEDAITRLYQGASVGDYTAVVNKVIANYSGPYADSFAEGVRQGASAGVSAARSEYNAWLQSQTAQKTVQDEPVVVQVETEATARTLTQKGGK